MARTYTIDGKTMTPSEVGAIENPTESQRKQFIEQSGLTDRDLSLMNAFLEGVAPVMREYVASALHPVMERLGTLENTTAEIEKHGVKFEGAFQRAQIYRRGAMVVHDGSLWSSLNDENQSTPGQSNSWQLCAKKGRDGKDAR